MARKRGVSFKKGTIAAKAAEKITRGVKKSGSTANPWAVARAAVKKMSPAKRAKVAKKR